MKAYKHPRFGTIKTDSQTVKFVGSWNGLSNKPPHNQIWATLPTPRFVRINTSRPLYKPTMRQPNGRVTHTRKNVHESRHTPPPVGLVKRVPTETAVRNHFGMGESVSPYYPQRIIEPVGQQTIEAHVVVPGLVSLIVATVATGATAFLCFQNEWTYTPLGYIFPGSFLITLFWRLGVADGLTKRLEEWTGIDLNNDGEIGDDTPISPRSIPVNRGGERTALELEQRQTKITADDWRKLATLLLHHGINFSRRAVISAGKQYGLHISQGEYQAMYAALNTAGMIGENGLNDNGRSWLMAYVPKHLDIQEG